MSKTITRTVYTFAELLELEQCGKATNKAIMRAREWMAGSLDLFEWWDYTYETWKEALEQIGFMEPDISFRGFGSQGDGASFTARINLESLVDFLACPVEPSTTIEPTATGENFKPWIIEKAKGVGFNPKFRHLAKIQDRIEAELKRDCSHYVHEHTVSFTASLNDSGEYVGDAWKEGTWKSDTPKLRTLFNEFQHTVSQLVLDLCRAIYRDLQEDYEYQTSDESFIDASDANEYTFTINGRRDG